MLYETYLKNLQSTKFFVNYSKEGQLWHNKSFNNLEDAKKFYDKCKIAFIHDKNDKLIYYKNISENLLKELGLKYIKYAKH